MDFQSAMETFAEAWMAANTKARPVEDSQSGSAVNVKSETAINPRDTGVITNGNSPTHESPISLIRDKEASPNPSKGGDATSPLAVHVVIECVPICHSRIGMDIDFHGRVEVDSYTLVPPNLRFSDLLQVVLAKTGFLDDLPYARAFLRLKNWRPLPVEQIPESDCKTVSEVLTDLAPLATLYIRLYSSARLRCSRDIKERLLRLLVTQSQHLLASAGCPLDENVLFSLIRGTGDISEEAARQFEAWWAVQVAHASRPPPSSAHTHILPHSHPGHALPQTPSHILDKVPSDPIHPALQQTLTSPFSLNKTRMRTSFDPEFELPRLHRWFAENQHPARLQIQQYVAELNALESRRGRKPLDVNNVVYWFKNARAAYKRQEFRSLNGMKSPPPDDVSVSDNEDVDYPSQALHQPPPHPRAQDSPRSPSTPHRKQQDGQLPPTSKENSLLTLTKKLSSHSDSPPLEPEEIFIKEEMLKSPSSGIGGMSDHGRNLPPTPGMMGRGPDSESPRGGDRNAIESDIDMSDDDDDCRSREGSIVDVKAWGSPSPVVSPGALPLPPYPGLPGLGQPGGVDRLPYSVMSGPLFQHSMMYMAQYMPQVPPFSSGLNSSSLPEERRKRNRTFIDPVTEVPLLEQWFAINTHPSHNLILKYTEELNRMPYRQKFPKLEPKNIQFWFKNRRAKCKRLRVSM